MAGPGTTTLGYRKGWWEKIYILEVARGMGITISHFIKNIANLRKGKVGMTHQFPETPKPIERILYKGEHRLMHRADGTPRCVACNCCSTACPAYCISIEAADTGHDRVEKYPVKFDIDILQCVFCGLCVEACPCDAIRMDTGKFPGAAYTGPKLIYDIDYLMNNHPEGISKVSEAIY
jgi:NADH-quinone oxidoreductase subunit I